MRTQTPNHTKSYSSAHSVLLRSWVWSSTQTYVTCVKIVGQRSAKSWVFSGYSAFFSQGMVTGWVEISSYIVVALRHKVAVGGALRKPSTGSRWTACFLIQLSSQLHTQWLFLPYFHLTFKSRWRKRIFPPLQCQINNMNLVFRISGDGSVKVKRFAVEIREVLPGARVSSYEKCWQGGLRVPPNWFLYCNCDPWSDMSHKVAVAVTLSSPS